MYRIDSWVHRFYEPFQIINPQTNNGIFEQQWKKVSNRPLVLFNVKVFNLSPPTQLGGLRSKSATELGSEAIREAVAKSGAAANQIDEVVMGCVLQAGLGQAPARQAALFAGLDNSTPCTTVNKVCASGMKAIMLSSLTLAQGIQVRTVTQI